MLAYFAQVPPHGWILLVIEALIMRAIWRQVGKDDDALFGKRHP
jgi:hypothetical protein